MSESIHVIPTQNSISNFPQSLVGSLDIMFEFSGGNLRFSSLLVSLSNTNESKDSCEFPLLVLNNIKTWLVEEFSGDERKCVQNTACYKGHVCDLYRVYLVILQYGGLANILIKFFSTSTKVTKQQILKESVVQL